MIKKNMSRASEPDLINEEEFDQQYHNWMKEFQAKPRFTRETLVKKIEDHADRLRVLRILKAPTNLQENEQRMLEEYMTDLRSENWAITDAEINYGKAWLARSKLFKYKETT